MVAKIYFSEEERLEAKRRNAKSYRERHPDRVKQRDQDWKNKNKEKVSSYRINRRNTKEGYVDRFLERAKIKTPDTDLTREFLLENMTVCNITGWTFLFENPYDCYHNPVAPSIDRIDSRKGYYKDNVQIILACLNRMKNDLGNKDFLTLWKALTNEM